MHRVVAMADADPALRRCVAGSHVTLAEVAYSMRDEMVQTMSDVVFRRTELGTGGHPGETTLDEIATFMQHTRGWSAKRTADERRMVDAQFERFLATTDHQRHASPARVTETTAEPAFLTNAV
jgi:glycerol-3-phosphate dehydrogenase